MKEEKIKKLINDWHSDLNKHYDERRAGRIDDRQVFNYMLDSCFFLFRQLATDFLESMK